MLFKDRSAAGQLLAERLNKFSGQGDVLLFALPRGGVIVGVEIAKKLNLPLDVVITRKIGAPYNPEYAIGALAETGEVIWNELERQAYRPVELEKMVAIEKQEAERRVQLYRQGKKLPDLKNKTVILIDDGVATGHSMRAAVRTIKKMGVSRLIVAVPHGASESLEQLRIEGAEVVALEEPKFYGSVGQFYSFFPQTSDEEVLELLQRFRPKTA